MLAIFLKFTAATGQRHPHLLTVIANHAAICVEMEVPPDEIVSRLIALGVEAGIDRETMQTILSEVFGGGA